MSRIDVIVPCYKYAHFLSECVESVLGQSPADVRVLIIDDASPDHTAEIAEELAGRDGRVEFRRHPVNRGHIATYNEGLDWAAGDYTLLLSADDFLAPGALARAVRLLDAHPEVGLAYGRGIVFQSGQPRPQARPASEYCGWRIVAGREFLEFCCTADHNPVMTATAVVRTPLQKQLGGYRKELPHSGDLEMWMRFAARAPVGILDADQAYYRLHNSNMSSNYYYTIDPTPNRWDLTALPDLKQRKAAFDTLFRDCSDSIAGHERLQLMANRTLSRLALWNASKVFEKGDVTSCQEMIDFALEIYPELRDRMEYAHMRWKQRVGPRLWSALRPVVDLLRGRHSRCSKGLC